MYHLGNGSSSSVGRAVVSDTLRSAFEPLISKINVEHLFIGNFIRKDENKEKESLVKTRKLQNVIEFRAQNLTPLFVRSNLKLENCIKL